MTPKEKAKDLINELSSVDDGLNNLITSRHSRGRFNYKIKQYALICVNEILEVLKTQINETDSIDVIYWQKVKNELQNFN